MKQIGLRGYRFSISWPRIIPAGVGEVNEEGVRFYNSLLDELLANGITPFVTLYHWDLPLALQTEFDGWLDSGTRVQDAFAVYARVCFQRFGDRVKNWITMNQPWVHSVMGFAMGVHAPGRKHNAHIEPYKCGHNLLLAHSRAVEVYRKEFQELQGGQIGITLSADWRLAGPTDNPVEMKENIAAAERSIAFHLGWFADPVYKGDYPRIMKDRLGDRLPKFTEEQKKLLEGSSDFFGLNNYSSSFAKPSVSYKRGELPPSDNTGSFLQDEAVTAFEDPSWEQTAAPWNFVTPWGLKELCLHISKTYQPKNGIFITENGSSWPDHSEHEGIKDVKRIDFFNQYLSGVHEAIAEGANVRGYFAWSLFDNLEWAAGL
jgi:beta-glucosidase/6-phospho-beta-glucosidase/beta-galactosidase